MASGWYSAGNVTLVSGSAAVTGTGTAWVDNGITAGMGFLSTDGRVYAVDSVVSNTSLTLARNYAGSNQTNVAYDILPLRGNIQLLIDRTNELLDGMEAMIDGPGAGKFLDGSAATPGITFSSDLDTGLYRIGANSIGLALSGAGVAAFTTAALQSIKPFAHTGTESDAVTPTSATGSFVGPGGYWQIRGGVDHAINFDVHNGGSPLNVLKVSQGGVVSFGTKLNFSTDSPFATGGNISSGNNTLAVGTTGATSFFMYTNNALRVNLDSSGNFQPGVDNTQTMGASSKRWSTYYGGTGTINTSDSRHKQQVSDIPDAWLDIWGTIPLVRFKFNDAVEAKGENARWHVGLIAQAIRDAFAAEGLDATKIGFLCHDSWEANEDTGTEAGDLWSIRPDECRVMEDAWKRREMAALTARITELESLIPSE